MSSFEKGTHSFIVRIWYEPREIEGAVPEWRGVIEHVPSSERHYFKNLDAIAIFINSYLVEMEVQPSLRWRLRRWLHR